jgi:hypothetical protein
VLLKFTITDKNSAVLQAQRAGNIQAKVAQKQYGTRKIFAQHTGN